MTRLGPPLRPWSGSGRTSSARAWGRALLALVLLAAPLVVRADEPGAVRAAVERLLSGYEPGDPGPALRRLGPPAAAVLLALAQDGRQPLIRLRAIEALGHVPTPAALALLEDLVHRRRGAREALAVYELAAAARALGAWPQAEGRLVGLLAHESADVREAAAEALGRIGTATATRALRGRLERERDPGVRAGLVRALAPRSGGTLR